MMDVQQTENAVPNAAHETKPEEPDTNNNNNNNDDDAAEAQEGATNGENAAASGAPPQEPDSSAELNNAESEPTKEPPTAEVGQINLRTEPSFEEAETTTPGASAAAPPSPSSSSAAATPSAAGSGEAGSVKPQASASLYIGDLHPEVTEQNLFEVFSAVGQVASVRVCRDGLTRKSLGYGYVNFHSVVDAERALDTMNFHSSPMTKGLPMRIMWKHRDPSVRKHGQGNIYVKNLDRSVDDKMLFDTFSPYGSIMSSKVQTDDQGNSRGYGFVHFENLEDAEKAINGVNGEEIAGKEVWVGPFQSKREREATGQANRIFTNVYIKNIDDSACSEEKINELFSVFGEITSLHVPMNDNGSPRGFAFVNFAEPHSAAEAVEQMNDHDINGKKLYVSRAQKRSERDVQLRQKYESIKLERFQKLQDVNLYVKNLNDDIDDDKLRALFSPYGSITSCKIMRDDRGNSRGFGFVCYSREDEATKAVNEMTGQIIGGKPIYVALKQPKEYRRAHLERMRTSAGAIPPSMYAQPGAPIFYQPGGVPPPMNAAMAAAASRGVQPPFFNQYIVGRGAPLQQVPGAVMAGRGYPQAPMAAMGHFDINAGVVAGGPQRQRPRGGSGRGGTMQGGRGRGGGGGGGPPGGGGSGAGGAQQQFKYTASARNAGQQNVGPPMPMVMTSQDQSNPAAAAAMASASMPSANGAAPLTIETLANASPAEQKTMLGDRLYPLVYEKEPTLAPKVTGMLLEMDNAEILHILESPDALNDYIDGAKEELQERAG